MIIQVVIVAAVFSIENDVVDNAKKCGVCKRVKKEDKIFFIKLIKGKFMLQISGQRRFRVS